MPPISRREARKSALTLLYQWTSPNGRPVSSTTARSTSTHRRSRAQSSAMRRARPQDHEAAAESGWTADRLGAVERNILRIAIHELDVGEIPPAAVIGRGRHPRQAVFDP